MAPVDSRIELVKLGVLVTSNLDVKDHVDGAEMVSEMSRPNQVGRMMSDLQSTFGLFLERGVLECCRDVSLLD